MTQELDQSNPFLEAVAAAVAQGKQKIGIVCDRTAEWKPVLGQLGAALGPVPLEDDGESSRGPSIWGLVPGCTVRMIDWGQSLAGRGFDAIIVLNRPVTDEKYSSSSVQRWIDQILRTRLLPGGFLEEVDG